MTRHLLICGLLALGTLAGKPNFTGTWKLNLGKSDYGPAPAPASMTREIKHEEPKIELKTTQSGSQGTFTTEMKFTTDGKESINETRLGPIKGTMTWDGDVLVHKYKVNSPQTGEVEITDRWSVSEDGKTLTVNGKLAGGFGEFDRKMVLEKQ